MGLLSSSLNSFKKLVGMLAEPNAFLVFSELIIDVTSSSYGKPFWFFVACCISDWNYQNLIEMPPQSVQCTYGPDSLIDSYIKIFLDMLS